MLAHEGKDNQMATQLVTMNPSALPVIPDPVGLPEAIAQAFTDAMKEVVNLIQSPLVAKRFATVALTKLRTQPDLQLCTPVSLIAVFVEAAEAGLDMSGQNECFIIPYRNRDKNGRVLSVEAQMQLGYAGLIKLALTHPDVLDVYAEKVCELDTWRYRGLSQRPEHEYPAAFAPRGAVVGFYSVAELSAGRVRCLQMSVAEMKAHAKSYSRNAEKKVWSDGPGGGFEGMALKTMLRKVCNPKMIPMSARASEILYKMDVVEGVIVPEPAEDTPETIEAHAREVAKTVDEHISDMFPPQDGGPTTPQQTQPPDDALRRQAQACATLRGNITALLNEQGVTIAQQQRWHVSMATKYRRASYMDLSEEEYRAIITRLLDAAEARDPSEAHSDEEPALPLETPVPPATGAEPWRLDLRTLAKNTLEVVAGATQPAFVAASIQTCEEILRLCDNPEYAVEESRQQFDRLHAIGAAVAREMGF